MLSHALLSRPEYDFPCSSLILKQSKYMGILTRLCSPDLNKALYKKWYQDCDDVVGCISTKVLPL